MSAVAIEGTQMPQRSRPVRITVDIDTEWHVWLSEQRRRDRVRTTERLRALLALAMEDPELRERVIKKAAELDAEQAEQRGAD